MRQYIRHPTDIPIEFSVSDQKFGHKKKLDNISAGGLCFRTEGPIDPTTMLHIVIPVCRPAFEVTAEVVWCRQIRNDHHVGVKFADADTAFAVRMVEQVCHIEQYRKDIVARGGRRMTSEEAAAEWISKYAKDFPR